MFQTFSHTRCLAVPGNSLWQAVKLLLNYSQIVVCNSQSLSKDGFGRTVGKGRSDCFLLGELNSPVSCGQGAGVLAQSSAQHTEVQVSLRPRHFPLCGCFETPLHLALRCLEVPLLLVGLCQGGVQVKEFPRQLMHRQVCTNAQQCLHQSHSHPRGLLGGLQTSHLQELLHLGTDSGGSYDSTQPWSLLQTLQSLLHSSLSK